MKRLLLLILSLNLLLSCEPKKQNNNHSYYPPVVQQPETPPVVTPDQPPVVTPEPPEQPDTAVVVTPPEQEEAEISVPVPEVITPNEPTPEQPKPNDPVFQIPEKRANLSTQHDFASTTLPRGFRKQTANPMGLQFVELGGAKWARFVLSANDNKNGVVRSEILKDSEPGLISRYGYTMRFPVENWQAHSEPDIITQWHNHEDKRLGEKPLVPPIALFAEGDYLHVMVCWDSKKVTTNTNREGKKNFKLIPLPKDQDVVFTWYVRHSYKTFSESDPRYKTEGGLIILAINGKQVLKYYGPNAYNDAEMPGYFKVGIYSRHIKYKRVVLLKDLYIGNEKSGFLDVMPRLPMLQ
ncbi:heparin lyase I family protein [Adhaeribacter arboris]|nr:heparin lyase I family protein [Adhaeribacter arboris]